MTHALPVGWKSATVDEIKGRDVGSVAIGPFGSRMKAERYVDQGVVVIRGKNLSTTRTLHGDFVFVSEETARDLAASRVRPYDLVFPHRGRIGDVGLVPDDANAYILSTSLMKLTCDPEVADSTFVFYYFRSADGRSEILKYASTVGTPGIGQPLASLRAMRLPLPPIDEQRAIAEVLDALDDKIDNNERIICAGEALLRARFDHFVDVQGGHGSESLGGLCKNIREPVEPTALDPLTPYVGLDHMRRDSVVLCESGVAADVTSGKSAFWRGDILFGRLRPYFRKVALAGAPGVCSSDILVLRIADSFYLPFVLMLASSQAFIDYCDAASSGTRMPRVSWADMASYATPVPDAQMISRLNDSAIPLLNRMVSAARE